MITKIAKIRNLGIFDESQCKSDLPEFKRYNVIYGWNGSGKTTLSQLFKALETGKTEIFPDLEYKIQTSDGDYTQAETYIKQQIRVFNRDYVSENMDISLCKAKPIFILGKENKELAEAIRLDEKILKGDPESKSDIGKIKELDLKKRELERKETEKGKSFSDVAKIISTNTSGVIARNYRKNNAEQSFYKLKTKQLLNDDDIQRHTLTLKQQEKPILNALSISVAANNIHEIILKAKALLQCTVVTATIDRLKENPDISKWVEQGIALHHSNHSVNCEFCNQPLPTKRIPELLAYFNEADKKLKDDIDVLQGEIEQVYAKIENVNTLDKANLYDELQESYLQATCNFNKQKVELLSQISDLNKEVEKKRVNTSISLELSANVFIDPFVNTINAINAQIQKHNSKTTNFAQGKTDSTTTLENHYLSEIFDEVKKLESEIVNIKLEIDLFEKGDPKDATMPSIAKIQQRILENRNKITTSGPACDEINKHLKTFLGRDELTFEVAEGGYIIKRKGKIAKNLSEGEKTAIAFIYFTIHLKDHTFKINDGIIVIDDPVCSMDSNSLFQAFAFLKNSVSDAAQVFILTHSFEFLRLLLNWLHRYPKKSGGKEFYMVKNQLDSQGRHASLERLDHLLRTHESEYNYLFKLLYEFQSDGTIESVYHVPNIARKVLEYFLLFMVPNNEGMYEKLDIIKFDKIKKTSIYKFTNDQSHISGRSFDPSLVPECQNNVKHILEMIKETFPDHHKILVDSINAGCNHE